ncbi:zinc-binding dehydrogenase [Candidatus Poribacteria bacterium]|nr:zinc-binding dehydrogenase [Candidatus Poribacteria bacterium]
MQVNAVVLKEPGILEMQQFPKPHIDKESILLKVDSVGVCGSDKHAYLGHSKLNFPVILGHEIVGTIEKLGAKAQECMSVMGGTLAEGDKLALVPSSQSCGKCYNCINTPHRTALCTGRSVYGFTNCEEPPHLFGGFSEYIYTHPRSWVFKLPDAVLDKDIGVLAEPMAVATRAVEKALSPGIPHIGEGYGIGKTVAVLGSGPIGLLVIAVLRSTGAGKIVATDLSESRLKMAEKMGATHTIKVDGKADERLQEVMDITDGVGPEIVFECAGVPSVFKESLDMVSRGGKVIEVGHYTDPGDIDINPHLICKKDMDIIGTWAYPQIQFKAAIAALSQFSLPLDELITHRMPLDKVHDSLDILGKPGVLKVVIEP